MKEIIELIEISKYAGERLDLVQAGGGNSSVKLDNGQMLIKASGFALSELTVKTGYSVVITNKVAEIIKNDEIITATSKRKREELTSKLIRKSTIDINNRPSIETLLHSVLLKYTLHTHPIALNIILSQKNWKDVLNSIFKVDQFALIGYHTPGIDLAIELNKEINREKTIPKILFLQNHGLIVTSDKIEEIEYLTEYVLNLVEAYLNIDFSKFKLTTQITNLLKRVENSNNISYLSNDIFLNDLMKSNKKLFFEKPFCPDSFVFCGICALEINDFLDLSLINFYQKKYLSLPKIIIYNNNIFIISESVKKAKEIEDVLKFHLMILSHNNSNINFLSQDELKYLGNWEAEKFRQKL
jgi:rhamnose utilization protein RhaD (predicted bifunctional aldolase and dehydrogenase)